jgi:ABC-2 type transport system permease protein
VTTLTGLWPLVRFTLRRDRVRLAVWILGIAVTTVISAASLLDVYPDQAAIDSYVRLFGDNPALVAFAGPGYGFDDPNIGVVLVNETQLYGMVATALMSIFLLNRSTRAEEDSERAELVLANVVGRHAPTAAATAVVALANVVIAVLWPSTIPCPGRSPSPGRSSWSGSCSPGSPRSWPSSSAAAAASSA